MTPSFGLRSLSGTAAYGSEATIPIRNVNPVNDSLSSGHASYAGSLPDAKASPATDSADLSGAGTLMSQAVGGPDVRIEKVAALRESIANGTYNVSAMDVAVGVMASMIW